MLLIMQSPQPLFLRHCDGLGANTSPITSLLRDCKFWSRQLSESVGMLVVSGSWFRKECTQLVISCRSCFPAEVADSIF
jgi:hypothetical protein